MERLRRELEDARNQVQNMGRSKGDEVSALLARFNKEKSDLEASLIEKQALIDEFLKQIEDQQGEADHIRQEKDEEIAVLQAGMDECLSQLAELQHVNIVIYFILIIILTVLLCNRMINNKI